jgi:hypothetical protein
VVGGQRADVLAHAPVRRLGAAARPHPRWKSSPCAAHTTSHASTRVALATPLAHFRAASGAIDTWSSRLADIGIESTLAANDSDLFSDTSAAASTCTIIIPDVQPWVRRQESRQLA